MNFSLSSLVRLIVLLVLGANTVAIGLGRLIPGPAGLGIRRPTEVRPVGISGYMFDPPCDEPHLLDPESGRILRLDLALESSLHDPSFSPWHDERGERHMVGRWIDRRGRGEGTFCLGYGLTRIAFPSGREVDRVLTDLIPVGPPCWYPGTSARVLFAAGDGQLYHHAFTEGEGDGAGAAKAQPRPERISWPNRPPGLDQIFLSDPAWPTIPSLGGRLIVSLSTRERSPDRRCLTAPQLWWLELDRYGTEVVSAGPLTVADPQGSAEAEISERSPSFTVTPEGELVIAYMERTSTDSRWRLRVAPVEFDAEAGTPRVRRSAGRQLIEGCAPVSPALSSDGRWVSCLLLNNPVERSVRRFLIRDALGPAPRDEGKGEGEGEGEGGIAATAGPVAAGG